MPIPTIFLIPHYTISSFFCYTSPMPIENADLSGTITNYNFLLWFFVAILTVLILFLGYLVFTARKAREEESKNRAWSHLTVEALETERRRVSRELHDSVLPMVEDQAVSEVIRSICHELMPPDFAQFPIKNALADICVQFAKKTGIECVCSIEEDLDFSPVSADNQLNLYRIVQECFNNIKKHSGAGKAIMVARRDTHGPSQSILICISDDGQGLPDTSAYPAGGLGIRSAHQRADIIGATLSYISEKGHGLMVKIEIPLTEKGGA
jgi:signal transduction histidine kinase